MHPPGSITPWSAVCPADRPPFVRKEQKEKTAETNLSGLFFGGDEGDRTPYLLNAIQALSQVSYTPTGYSVLVLGRSVSRRRVLL